MIIKGACTMDKKEYRTILQRELVEVLDDIKRIKFMHCDPESIKEKRKSCELRLNAIQMELEGIRNEEAMNGRPRPR